MIFDQQNAVFVGVAIEMGWLKKESGRWSLAGAEELLYCLYRRLLLGSPAIVPRPALQLALASSFVSPRL